MAKPKKFDLPSRIARTADKVFNALRKKGYDVQYGRKFAAAEASWCSMHPATGSSRRKGGACELMWRAVVAKFDALVEAA